MPKHIINEQIEMTEQTARRLIDALDRTTGATTQMRRIRSNHIVSAFVGAIGLALFIVGVERAAADLPIVSNAYGSIFVGVVLLAATGALLTRLGGIEVTSTLGRNTSDDDGEG